MRATDDFSLLQSSHEKHGLVIVEAGEVLDFERKTTMESADDQLMLDSAIEHGSSSGDGPKSSQRLGSISTRMYKRSYPDDG